MDLLCSMTSVPQCDKNPVSAKGQLLDTIVFPKTYMT